MSLSRGIGRRSELRVGIDSAGHPAEQRRHYGGVSLLYPTTLTRSGEGADGSVVTTTRASCLKQPTVGGGGTGFTPVEGELLGVGRTGVLQVVEGGGDAPGCDPPGCDPTG